uniref:Uncharacterized protein n=1 Tax=Chromera velia CCMP2878 TaxID=1169474 RepID=A0A0G4HM86_9ALVE|eukprot:Cvel_1161.t1-p1 / transcript=Cvel_1161.t1 / gene=Cvel_1161 / organism=Chromera_velia_CCMP2878 / gene_product=hypothetical protein / transcript_product=hypothetical protein / location=Cvel_scaffold38:115964-119509(-) / protein_length=510 / sequence_SO=supercontig / SO=protein_coding / is_pseudo=false
MSQEVSNGGHSDLASCSFASLTQDHSRKCDQSSLLVAGKLLGEMKHDAGPKNLLRGSFDSSGPGSATSQALEDELKGEGVSTSSKGDASNTPEATDAATIPTKTDPKKPPTTDTVQAPPKEKAETPVNTVAAKPEEPKASTSTEPTKDTQEKTQQQQTGTQSTTPEQQTQTQKEKDEKEKEKEKDKDNPFSSEAPEKQISADKQKAAEVLIPLKASMPADEWEKIRLESALLKPCQYLKNSDPDKKHAGGFKCELDAEVAKSISEGNDAPEKFFAFASTEEGEKVAFQQVAECEPDPSSNAPAPPLVCFVPPTVKPGGTGAEGDKGKGGEEEGKNVPLLQAMVVGVDAQKYMRARSNAQSLEVVKELVTFAMTILIASLISILFIGICCLCCARLLSANQGQEADRKPGLDSDGLPSSSSSTPPFLTSPGNPVIRSTKPSLKSIKEDEVDDSVDAKNPRAALAAAHGSTGRPTRERVSRGSVDGSQGTTLLDSVGEDGDPPPAQHPGTSP